LQVLVFVKKEIASSFFSGAAESKRDFSFTTTVRDVNLLATVLIINGAAYML
jgi:hypothetical protein